MKTASNEKREKYERFKIMQKRVERMQKQKEENIYLFLIINILLK